MERGNSCEDDIGMEVLRKTGSLRGEVRCGDEYETWFLVIVIVFPLPLHYTPLMELFFVRMHL